MRDPMEIYWNYSINRPGRLEGQSVTWTDDGAPLSYVVTYREEFQGWAAHFEGFLVHSGTLPRCLAACEEADRTGEFRPRPTKPTLIPLDSLE